MHKHEEETRDEYPMRINKYLAHQGLATRRGADEFIAKGKVLVNGVVAKLGDKVRETDRVELVGKMNTKKYRYYAYHKPRGTATEDIDEKDVFPIGRLDKDSSGLIILTNDGRITDRLLSPRYEHDKEYRVRTLEPLRESFKKTMEAGVNIEGYLTEPCKVRVTGPHSFLITLTEGKKHRIRRMLAALHNQVVELTRVRVLNIRLDDLPSGKVRPIEGVELATFLSTLGLK